MALVCTTGQVERNRAVVTSYDALAREVVAAVQANPALVTDATVTALQKEISAFGTAFTAAGGTVTAGMVCDEGTLVAFIQQLSQLGARWAAATKRPDVVVPFKPSLTPPAPPWEPSIGWLLKWGLVAGIVYIGYRWATAAGAASERIRPTRANSYDEIPRDQLPAYAGGPKRRRRK